MKRRYGRGGLALLAVIAAGLVGPGHALAEPPAPVDLAELDALAWSGDIPKIKRALKGYQELDSADPSITWRLARTYFNLYDETPPDEKEQKTKYALLSAGWGRTAADASPDTVEAQYWFAMSLLAVTDVKGALTFLKEMGRIKKLMYWVRERDPKIDDAGPDRFLTIYFLEAPWPWGDKKDAFEHVEKAMKIAPERCANVYLAARIHLKRDSFERADTHIRVLEADECTATSPMWHGIYVERGAELRKKLRNARK